MSWKNICIGDLGEVITGNTPPKKIKEFYGTDYKFIKPTDMGVDSRYTPETDEHYSLLAYEKYKKSLIPPLSTCVVTIGSIGEKMTLTSENSFINQAVNAVIPNTEYYDPFFVFYALKNILPNVKKADTGASSGRENVSKSNFMSLPLSVPESLDTQKKIADILSAYDDLIENNLKRIKLLEQAAQNIYKEWFVHMRFPGHEDAVIDKETGLPEGWESRRSDSVFKINIGKTPPRKEPEWFSKEEGIKWASISDMNKSIVFIQNTKERITNEGVTKFNVKVVPKGTVLLSFKLTIGSVVIATEDMVTNEAIAHFNIDKNTSLSTEYTYCFLSCFPYATLGSTSSIGQALNSKIVKAIPVLVPKIDVVELFTKTVSSLFGQLENLVTQNQKLKSARDILLPRLMNRIIEV